MTSPSVIKRAVRSAIWMFADTWGSALFGLVSFTLMARFLGPDPYGVMALAALIFGVVGIFVGAPLTESIQQREEVSPDHLDTTFWLNSGLTVLFAIPIVVFAGPLSVLVSSEQVGEILPALSLVMVIGSISAVPGALLERNLHQHKVVMLGAGAGMIATLVALFLAWAGFGVWALVANMAISTMIMTVGSFWLSGWRPGFRISRQAFLDLFAFNTDTILTYLIGYVDNAIPRFLLSIIGGERAVGLLSIAHTISGMLTGMLMGPFNEIAMNVIARLQSDRRMLRDLLDRVFTLTTTLLYPSTLGLAAIVPFLVPLMFGEEWQGAVLPLQILLVLGIRDATGTFNISILRGVGDTRSPILILSVGTLLLAALAPVLMPYGVAGIAAMIALRTFLTWPLSATLVERAAGYPARHQFLVGWRSLLCSLVMFASVMLLPIVLPADWPAAAIIAVMVTAGVAIYAGLMWLAAGRQIDEIKSALKWFRSHDDILPEPA
ncbi:hypothetical protein HY29_10260 [Hyphomonas beringensis]|uniref:Uncharacterized protein n=1 Tax=Hyphomonas beringensis TaxID=1280946 RepID=A0A062UBS2_9PROT|nr:oligosaccharide flippase family protein [Hyphomonas beringensis]KCZ55742.1 hypothetical protein HY29_10260 [Hyphomonas beringensis]